MPQQWTRFVIAMLALTALGASYPQARTMGQLADRYRTPRAVANFLQRDFTFQSDTELFGEEEYWQQPEEFLKRRSGDCEDYAVLAKAILTRNRIKAHLFNIYGADGFAHTVCVFIDSHGFYHVIDQDILRQFRAHSLEDVASRLYPDWTIAGIVEQNGTQGRFVKRLTNP